SVISYLITHFGPGAPAAGGAVLPTGPGKELVETRCAVCHSLERVTIVKRQKRDWDIIVANMYERWGMSAPDEVQAIAAYLNAQSGRNGGHWVGGNSRGFKRKCNPLTCRGGKFGAAPS